MLAEAVKDLVVNKNILYLKSFLAFSFFWADSNPQEMH